MADDASDEESTGTVLLAGSANLAIAIAKLVGGLISGSTAMLAEAAHSFADTLNQVFLMAALKRSKKPADALHPFGYGMERYFWSLIAAVGIFVLGAGYSIFEGIKAVLEPEELGSLLIAYVVLALSFLFEGVSWLKAVRQLSGEAKEQGRGFFEHLKITSDPTAKTVAFEDTAALIGIVLAAVGITLHHVTGQGFWDGLASILIGLLLVVVAYSLGQQNKRALIGEALPAGGPGGDPRHHRRLARRRQPGRDADDADVARGGARGRARGPRRQLHRRRAREGVRGGRAPGARGAPGGAARVPRPDGRPGRER